MILAPHSNAQWYSKYYGKTDLNEHTFDELQFLTEKAERVNVTGKIMTFGGITMAGVGIIIILNSFGLEMDLSPGPSSYSEFGIDLGSVLFVTGSIATILGIPTWSIGANRKYHIRQAPKFNKSNSGSLSMSPIIGNNQINNTHYLGMSVSLNF